MKMYHHGQLPQGTIHPPHNWHVGDLSEIQPTARDINKWALVGSIYYRLVSIEPVEWVELMGAVVIPEDGIVLGPGFKLVGNQLRYDFQSLARA